jgi:hypothetical protein
MALARLGYCTAAVDGPSGPRTDAALTAVAVDGSAIRNRTPAVGKRGRRSWRAVWRSPGGAVTFGGGVWCGKRRPDGGAGEAGGAAW